MRALITGATGMLGAALARTLVERGADVRALVRPTADRGPLAGLPLTFVTGDAADVARHAATAATAVAGVDTVFHLAAHLSADAPFTPRLTPQMRAVNIDFTRALLQAALDHSVQRFVFMSSSSVYAPQADGPIAEDAPLGPRSGYGRSKVAGEHAVRAAADDGLVAIIVRAPVIYGPGDRYFTPTLRRLAMAPLLPLPAAGSARVDVVFVEDVVDLLWLAATHPSAAGSTFNAGMGSAVPLRRLIETVRDVLGRGPRVFSVPLAPLTLAGRLVAPLLRDVDPVLALAIFTQRSWLDIGRARRELGYAPAADLDAGVRAALSKP